MWLEALLIDWLEHRLAKVHTPVALTLWNGHRIVLGDPAVVEVEVTGPRSVRALLQPTFSSLARAYVDGDLDVDGQMMDALSVAEALCEAFGGQASAPMVRRDRRRTREVDAEQVRFHDDVSNRFYALFLDDTMSYSCAYYTHDEASIAQAQHDKRDHICRKLMLKPGDRLLDVGCGWGGLLMHAAREYGVRATGITVSGAQLELAKARIREAKLCGSCDVLLLDYRDLPPDAAFDKIASVGMMEHVGLSELGGYFRALERCLAPGGLLLNQAIASRHADQRSVAYDGGRFLEEEVLPGPDLPHLSRVIASMTDEGLEPIDVEGLGRHHERTLLQWLARLEAHAAEAEALVGARRYRTWRVYLAGSALCFRRGWVALYQTLSAKRSAHGALSTPWTRRHQYGPTLSLASPLVSPERPARGAAARRPTQGLRLIESPRVEP